MHTPSRPAAPPVRPSARRWPAILTALAAFALVVGCAQTPANGDPDPDPDPQPTVLRGTAAWADLAGAEPGPLLGVSLWMLVLGVLEADEAAVESATGHYGPQALRSRAEGLYVDGHAPHSSNVVDIGGGDFLAGFGLVASDGTYELVLPDGDAIPEALFYDAEDALPVHWYATAPGCTLEAGDPTARVTLTLFEGVTIASPVFLTPMGLAAGLTATEAVFPDFEAETGIEDTTFVSLAYATAPTTLITTGAGCAPETGFTVDVDVDLAAGWNQLTWDFVPDESLTVRDRPMDEPVFSLVMPYDDL